MFPFSQINNYFIIKLLIVFKLIYFQLICIQGIFLKQNIDFMLMVYLFINQRIRNNFDISKILMIDSITNKR